MQFPDSFFYSILPKTRLQTPNVSVSLFTLSQHSPLITSSTGASTTGNTVAMVEEFVGIIAATLIVMRPCLHSLGKAIGWSTTTHSTSGGHSKISGLSYGMDTIHSRSQGFNKIMRTTEVTLENRSVSTEHILSQKSVYSG